jgi:hypothetical protein
VDDASFYRYAKIARDTYVHPAVARFLAENPSPPQPVIFATFSTVAAACLQIHKDDPPQAAIDKYKAITEVALRIFLDGRKTDQEAG